MQTHSPTPGRRPSLQTRRSPNGTTLYLNFDGISPQPTAYVFCLQQQRACRRDSFSHAIHTARFAVSKAVRHALHLRPPSGQMAFPPTSQGRDVRSPLREFPPAID